MNEYEVKEGSVLITDTDIQTDTPSYTSTYRRTDITPRYRKTRVYKQTQTPYIDTDKSIHTDKYRQMHRQTQR